MIALKRPLIHLGILVSISMLFYFTIGTYTWKTNLVQNPSSTLTFSSSTQIALEDNVSQVKINTSTDFYSVFLFFFLVYGQIIMGWYLGCSFAFFPLKLIKDFVYRPQKPDAETLVLARQCLVKQSEELIEQGRDLYDKRRDFQMNK